MKYFILLLICAAGYGQDTLCLPAAQVKEIYQGLKSREYMKRDLRDCRDISLKLNKIVHEQNDSLLSFAGKIRLLNSQITEKQNQLTEAEIKALKTPWYKKWYLWLSVGFIGGLLIK